MTDNRLGADGGGAIMLGVAFAVLGWRLFRLRLSGFVALLAAVGDRSFSGSSRAASRSRAPTTSAAPSRATARDGSPRSRDAGRSRICRRCTPGPVRRPASRRSSRRSTSSRGEGRTSPRRAISSSRSGSRSSRRCSSTIPPRLSLPAGSPSSPPRPSSFRRPLRRGSACAFLFSAGPASPWSRSRRNRHPASADLRVPLPEGAPLRALPVDERACSGELRRVRRRAGRAGAVPDRDPLQGLGLLHDRLRQGESREEGRRRQRGRLVLRRRQSKSESKPAEKKKPASSGD